MEKVKYVSLKGKLLSWAKCIPLECHIMTQLYNRVNSTLSLPKPLSFVIQINISFSRSNSSPHTADWFNLKDCSCTWRSDHPALYMGVLTWHCEFNTFSICFIDYKSKTLRGSWSSISSWEAENHKALRLEAPSRNADELRLCPGSSASETQTSTQRTIPLYWYSGVTNKPSTARNTEQIKC